MFAEVGAGFWEVEMVHLGEEREREVHGCRRMILLRAGGQVRRPRGGEAISGSHQTLRNRRPSHTDNSVTRWVAKASVTFALRRGYGGRTPSELTETCGGRRETEVALGWPYAVWLYFTGRRVAVE